MYVDVIYSTRSSLGTAKCRGINFAIGADSTTFSFEPFWKGNIMWTIYVVIGFSFLMSAIVIIDCLRNGGFEDKDIHEERKLF